MRLFKAPAVDPEVGRRLDAVDALLAGESPRDIDAELAELMTAVAADRPVPREEFARALDARAAGGFGKQPVARTPRAARRLLRRGLRPLPLAAGTGAAAFIVVVAIVAGGGGGDSTGGAGDGARSSASEPGTAAAPATGAAKESAPASAIPPAPGSTAPRARARKVERSASLTLAPPSGRVEEVADGVVRFTDRYGGFVFNSTVSSGDGAATASLDLRLPSSRLQQAIADLSKLAHVRSRSQASQDITARFAGPRGRLADALGERRALLRLLAKADTANETASIRARLRLAADRIDAARAALRRLENRVDYAAVSVSVEPGKGKSGGGAWTAGDAYRDALDVLQAVAGALLIALAVLVPPALLVLLAYAGRRAYLKRAREASLGG